MLAPMVDRRWRWAGVLVCVVTAVSQLSTATERLHRPVWVPGASVALSRDVGGWLGSPATTLATRGASLGLRGALGGASRDDERGAGWALTGALPLGPIQLGVAMVHGVDPAPLAEPTPALAPSQWVLGLAGRLDGWFDLGAALHVQQDLTSDLGALTTLDLGVRAAPWRWLSVGVHVRDLLGGTLFRYPPSAAVIAGPLVQVGAALHLFDRQVQLAVDLRWPNAGDVDMASLQASWRRPSGSVVGVQLRWGLVDAVGGGLRDTRAVAFVRLPARGLWGDAALRLDRTTGNHAGADVGVAWTHAPPRGFWADLGRRWRRRRRVQAARRTSAGHLTHIARRQARGWEGPLAGAEQRAAAAVARAYLRIAAAFAQEDTAALCAAFAPQVRLDVTSANPAVQGTLATSRALACAALRQPGSLWARYLRELGPAAVHADAPTYVGRLFAMHGSPYEWVPRAQERAYRLAMRKASRRCHTWRVLPVRRVAEGRRVVDVVVLCEGVRDFVMQLEGSTGAGYRLRKLLLER